MDSSLKPHDNHFVALGQLLTGAGVPADRTEQLVTGLLERSARETRLTVSRDICALVDGYIHGLDERYATRLDDAQKLMTKLAVELEVSRRRMRDERFSRNRTVISLILLQLVASAVILVSLNFNDRATAVDVDSAAAEVALGPGLEVPER